ncbi:hypothetical protein AVEN_221469-1 [Araneus ventricosus]|uniref:Helitron helicase-like domain-containing protein n=1 Tax=Araneus ventricosus TaxID=182803 RepID=A0A4Y2VG55_ARAVE|nr:hypothetical protein AVEN_221469-1 [Araneus ventricosus]
MKVHLTEAPDLFKQLICTNSQEAKNYQQQIREYNAALAFASMGAEIKAPLGTHVHSVYIHGQIYHMVSPLCSNERHNLAMDNCTYLTPVKQGIDVLRIIKPAFTL